VGVPHFFLVYLEGRGSGCCPDGNTLGTGYTHVIAIERCSIHQADHSIQASTQEFDLFLLVSTRPGCRVYHKRHAADPPTDCCITLLGDLEKTHNHPTLTHPHTHQTLTTHHTFTTLTTLDTDSSHTHSTHSTRTHTHTHTHLTHTHRTLTTRHALVTRSLNTHSTHSTHSQHTHSNKGCVGVPETSSNHRHLRRHEQR
jgi:hypothetical protein